jgi:hypothetical protein
MRSRWLLAVMAAGWLCSSACATSTSPSSTGSGDGGDPGTGGSPTTSTSTGTGGAGGTGGSTSCVLASDCDAFTDQCNLGTCINGECQAFPANEDVACNDGLNCTLTESCKAGVCTATQQKFCPASDSCHVGTCDLVTDGCTEMPGNDGAGCIDDNPCTLTGVCSGGVCAPGQMVDCSFLNSECGVGVCDPVIGCKATPQNNGFPCDDGLFCTDFDQCIGGSCSGSPKACAPPGNVCLIGTCDEISDICIATPGNNGAACDDGNLCTGGETCSAGSCVGGSPANDGVVCDDFNGCTGGTTCLGGSCAAPTSEILTCIDDDSCCPAACENLDADCIISVAIVTADDPTYMADVQASLVNTAAFSAVDLIDVQFSTPSLAQLTPYKALLVYSDSPFGDPFALGNVVADYFDAGGRVVLAPGANCNGFSLQGRFFNDGYMVLGYGDLDSFPPDTLGTIFEPASPLVTGVSVFSADMAIRCLGSPTPGSVTVAAWNDGQPLIVRGMVQGRNRVDLNLFPVSDNAAFGSWIGDGAEIMRNALLFD